MNVFTKNIIRHLKDVTWCIVRALGYDSTQNDDGFNSSNCVRTSSNGAPPFHLYAYSSPALRPRPIVFS